MITKEMIEKVINKIVAENTKEYISIKATPSTTLTISDSKFGGLPYLPIDFEVPKKDSVQLTFLAQINCAALPKNDIFPSGGLLQFWIGRDELFGANLDGSPSTHRVIYFSEIDGNIKEEDILAKYSAPNNTADTPFHPSEASFSLSFERAMSTITINDFQFENLVLTAIKDLYPETSLNGDLYDILEEDARTSLYTSFSGVNHAIGAFPSFSQWDARDDEKNSAYDVSLLQVQSIFSNEDSFEIMWGDCGVANFFIKSADLKVLNFDNTLFVWDCA